MLFVFVGNHMGFNMWQVAWLKSVYGGGRQEASVGGGGTEADLDY